jgi:roadblock/LC7 domain-containing protein
MNQVPQKGWMYGGGDYTVVVGGTKRVFVETAKADFNELYRALVGSK